MITFNIQAPNGNYYCGHEPSNKHDGPWDNDIQEALVFTIDQARALVAAWLWGFLKIVISPKADPMTDEAFAHELFCAKGGRWYDYKKES